MNSDIYTVNFGVMLKNVKFQILQKTFMLIFIILVMVCTIHTILTILWKIFVYYGFPIRVVVYCRIKKNV